MMPGVLHICRAAGCGLIAAVLVAAGFISRAAAQGDSSSLVAVWVTHAQSVEGAGVLEDYLLDRLGSNGMYPVNDPERVRAAGSFVGLDRTTSFDRQRLAALGRALGARWVLWVKVADRAVEFKKGLSIPHLFTRRKAVVRLLVDARVIDVFTGELLGSNRWRPDKSGAGSYQVAEDMAQDPVYNNSASQFARYEQELEWEAARSISIWFKSLVPRAAGGSPGSETRRPVLPSGPFGAKEGVKDK